MNSRYVSSRVTGAARTPTRTMRDSPGGISIVRGKYRRLSAGSYWSAPSAFWVQVIACTCMRSAVLSSLRTTTSLARAVRSSATRNGLMTNSPAAAGADASNTTANHPSTMDPRRFIQGRTVACRMSE